MDAVICLSGGNFKGISCNTYFSKKYSKDGLSLHSELLDSDCFFSVSNVTNLNHCKMGISTSYESFIRIELNSPFADIDSIKSNVQIKITATFGAFGWAGFYLFRLYKKLKGIKK